MSELDVIAAHLRNQIPFEVTLDVNYQDIRDALSASDWCGQPRTSTLSPVTRALPRTGKFVNGEFTERGLVLITGAPARRILYEHCPELVAYVRAWASGAAVEPAKFTLRMVQA